MNVVWIGNQLLFLLLQYSFMLNLFAKSVSFVLGLMVATSSNCECRLWMIRI